MAASSSSSSASSSTSYQSQDPPPRAELWWDRIPSLKIVRPPRGQYSPQVDERCFTYCSQNIAGRIQGNDPWCRTICFRRVFSHEVTRVLAHHRSQTVTHVPGKRPIIETKDEVETAPVNHPLPPEGQKYSGWLEMLLSDRFAGGDPEGSHEDETHMILPEHGQRETKHWQEGWYLWWTNSRWAAQEKLDLMRRDLEGQTEWQRLKEKRNDEWARGVPLDESAPEGAQVEPHPFEDLGNLPPFPDVSSHSLLLPLPLPPSSFSELYSSLETQFRPVLAPTQHVLEVLRESIQSGSQKELAGKMWEKAWSDEPRKLLVVAWGRVRENFFGGEEEGGQQNSGGGGKDEKK